MLGFFRKNVGFRSPSPEYPTIHEAVLAAVTRHAQACGAAAGGWVTIEGRPAGGAPVVVQVAGDRLNLLLEEADVAAVLRDSGLTALAGVCGLVESGLWRLAGASPEEMAAAACLVLERCFGMGSTDPLVA